MGWPSTVNFSKEVRAVPAPPRPAVGVWAISNGTIASPTTAPIITLRFISISQLIGSLAFSADKVKGLYSSSTPSRIMASHHASNISHNNNGYSPLSHQTPFKHQVSIIITSPVWTPQRRSKWPP